MVALAPLDRIVTLADPLRLRAEHLPLLPPSNTVFRIPVDALEDAATRKHCAALAGQGYRLQADGTAGFQQIESGISGIARDMSAVPPPNPPEWALLTMAGPHWAYGVASAEHHAICRDAGFHWFSGDAARLRGAGAGDCTSRKRLLALLALLAEDADSRELEAVLKQDPALSYHLLKVVNSAAFGLPSPVHHFGQAINVLGRRQLQRWLQLLLYARPQPDGPIDPLLPQAALRAAQMEALCLLQGGDRERQDLAFVTGVFALLDVLLAMPMADIVGALRLDADIVAALLGRTGPLGELLALVEQAVPDPARVAAAGLTHEQFWQGQLQGWQWAIQVGRNLR
jgi:EAL and modified HD-GYP domain-containing signal transduction protein